MFRPSYLSDLTTVIIFSEGCISRPLDRKDSGTFTRRERFRSYIWRSSALCSSFLVFLLHLSWVKHSSRVVSLCVLPLRWGICTKRKLEAVNALNLACNSLFQILRDSLKIPAAAPTHGVSVVLSLSRWGSCSLPWLLSSGSQEGIRDCREKEDGDKSKKERNSVTARCLGKRRKRGASDLADLPLPQRDRADSFVQEWHMLFRSCTSLTPWPQSASELYQPSDCRFSAKLVLTFADRECRVVSSADPLRSHSRCSRLEPLLFFSSSSSVVLTRVSGPRTRPTTSQEIW
jgi:hypothetical protein